MRLNINDEFMEWIQQDGYPCLGAKAATRQGCMEFIIANDIQKADDDISILSATYQFIDKWEENNQYLQTLIIIFKNSKILNEIEFEKALWSRLQNLHTLDSELYSWNKKVSSDVTNPEFSFSMGGYSFFIVGLHPNSSRKARQFKYPSMVLNLHEQFEKVRDKGFFKPMRDKIRENDQEFSGKINPMVNDFGVITEAIQYSGREVDENHKCPFIMSKDETPWLEISPSSGKGFILHKGDLLVVKDVEGEQVSDLFCFAKANKNEVLSSGRTIDYNEKILLTQGDILYSNLSNPMLSIIRDDVKRHDFLLTPCNADTFKKLYVNSSITSGCYENLVKALEPFDIDPLNITTTFNIFMNVTFNQNGVLSIKPPLSKKNDMIIFKSEMDLIVGLTACSAPKSNNNSLKPIQYKLIKQDKNQRDDTVSSI